MTERKTSASAEADPCGMTARKTKASASTTADPHGMTNKKQRTTGRGTDRAD
jgi:hypothetical protein